MIKTIYFYREKEDNIDLVNEYEETYGKSGDDLIYTGMEVEFEIDIDDKGIVKILHINGVNIEDKDINI